MEKENFSTPENKISKIAKEISEMDRVDQEMRKRDLESDNEEGEWDPEVDVKHTARMKEIVEEIGWPTISKVGEEASYNAWLLVQHADHDVDFQIQCLELMKQVPEGEVNKQNIAFLEDRIRVNQGQKQLYGTQFIQEEGKHIPQPIEDEENIDARRAFMGMGTMEERIQEMYDKYPFTKN